MPEKGKVLEQYLIVYVLFGAYTFDKFIEESM